MWVAFAVQKLLTFFSKKYQCICHIFKIKILKSSSSQFCWVLNNWAQMNKVCDFSGGKKSSIASGASGTGPGSTAGCWTRSSPCMNRALHKQCFQNRSVAIVFTLSIRTPQLLTILVPEFEQVQFTTQCCVWKNAGWVANSVNLDEMPHSAASHLVLYCLLRPVCQNTYSKYGTFLISPPK